MTAPLLESVHTAVGQDMGTSLHATGSSPAPEAPPWSGGVTDMLLRRRPMACETKEFLETLGRPLGPQGAGLDAAKAQEYKCRILSIGPCL